MSNPTPIVSFVYNRYRKASPTQDAIVELRITYQRRQKYMATGIRLLPNQWSRGRCVNRLDSVIINKTLDKLMMDVRNVIYQMMEDGHIDIFAIPAKLQAAQQASKTFVEYCEERAKVRKYGKATDTQERYDHIIQFLKDYGKIKTFDDVHEPKIMELDRFLRAKGTLIAKSRWHNYHRFINSFIIDAQRDRLIDCNPYDSVHIDHGDDGDGINKYLTLDEFKQLKNAQMSCERLERVRDLFILQSYTCLAYTDLRNFDPSKIRVKDSKRYYVGHRGKTKIEYTIPILAEAQAIIDKYQGNLPMISNVKYNAYLKEVFDEVKINKPVTTHWARHTGATLLLNAGVPMQTVSKICGHSSIRMTEKIYAKMLPETVVAAVYSVEDKLK